MQVYGGRRIRLAFIFGRLYDDPRAENDLRAESQTFGDVIQGDFGENYRNMTLKSLTGLHWVLKYCSSAQLVLHKNNLNSRDARASQIMVIRRSHQVV